MWCATSPTHPYTLTHTALRQAQHPRSHSHAHTLTRSYAHTYSHAFCVLLTSTAGAWAFNSANQTITSVMSGKCLEARLGSSTVEVSVCSGGDNQKWKWAGASGKADGAVESVARPGQCIDMGAFPAPPGTNGNCASLTKNPGGYGPGVR
jgi:hypothetical protein